MNHTEAVKVLREALFDLTNCAVSDMAALSRAEDAIAATENIEQDEPVAWSCADLILYGDSFLTRNKEAAMDLQNAPEGIHGKTWSVIPLYATPQPAPQPAKADVVVSDSLKVIALFLEYERLMDSDNHHAGMLKYAELHNYCKMFEKVVAAPSTDKP